MSVLVARTVHINATPEQVWGVMINVEKWPEWTASMKSVERLEEGPLGLESRARLRIRRAPRPGIWKVTEFTEGRSFTWENDSGGVHGVATHLIEPENGGCNVTLTVTLSGLVAMLFGWVMAGASRENVRMEVEGLKARSEERE